jgi:hypothetical protein
MIGCLPLLAMAGTVETIRDLAEHAPLPPPLDIEI